MARTTWKTHERNSAALIDGQRFPANMGGRLDVESEHFVGQCKNPKTLALAAIERLAIEMSRYAERVKKIGLVFVKRSCGAPTPNLVVMTEHEFRKLGHVTKEVEAGLQGGGQALPRAGVSPDPAAALGEAPPGEVGTVPEEGANR